MADTMSDNRLSAVLAPFFGGFTPTEDARRALDAIERAGYKVVPVEPTPEMVYTGKGRSGISPGTVQVIYRNMLAAAPAVTNEPAS